MCGLFATPSPPPPPIMEPPPPPIMEQESEREEVGRDLERRRAAARRGFESTWLTRGSRVGVPGGGAATQQPQQPQTVLRKTMGA
jgi:hypothetical protein